MNSSRTPVSDRSVVPPGPHKVSDIAAWRHYGYITPELAVQLYVELPVFEPTRDPSLWLSELADAVSTELVWQTVHTGHLSGIIPHSDYELALELHAKRGRQVAA